MFVGENEKFEVFEDRFHTMLKLQPEMTEATESKRFHAHLLKKSTTNFLQHKCFKQTNSWTTLLHMMTHDRRSWKTLQINNATTPMGSYDIHKILNHIRSYESYHMWLRVVDWWNQLLWVTSNNLEGTLSFCLSGTVGNSQDQSLQNFHFTHMLPSQYQTDCTRDFDLSLKQYYKLRSTAKILKANNTDLIPIGETTSMIRKTWNIDIFKTLAYCTKVGSFEFYVYFIALNWIRKFEFPNKIG